MGTLTKKAAVSMYFPNCFQSLCKGPLL